MSSLSSANCWIARSRSASSGAILVVADALDLGGLERPAAGELDEAEPLPPLDDDVEPAVREALQHPGDRGERPDLANPVLIGEDEPELAVARQALPDQLLVAILEDVQRHALGREQDELERKESDLGHLPTDYDGAVGLDRLEELLHGAFPDAGSSPWPTGRAPATISR